MKIQGLQGKKQFFLSNEVNDFINSLLGSDIEPSNVLCYSCYIQVIFEMIQFMIEHLLVVFSGTVSLFWALVSDEVATSITPKT